MLASNHHHGFASIYSEHSKAPPVKCLRCYIMLALFLITFEGQTSTIYWLLLQYASEHCSRASAALTDEKIRSRSCEGNILFYRI